ncbi:hypothetical protein R3P38DRAFT_3182457 [Favolaschia claudopus]|uniref:Uncharacterized protein n=1 Tax=Favolaschia claudopus TaxID=2862362 RepID=A0AAW0CJZ2_9AGAR
MFPVYIPPHWTNNRFAVYQESIDVPGALHAWRKPPTFKPVAEKGSWTTYRLTQFHGILIWLESSGTSKNAMYDRHMRRKLYFETVDEDTMLGVVLPQVHGMPVPPFFFMSRSNYGLIPQRPSIWMYPTQRAPASDVTAVLALPSAQLLSTKPQTFINQLNHVVDDDEDEDWDASEHLRRPLLHECPTNVLTVEGEFAEVPKTALDLRNIVMDRFSCANRPVQILAIAQDANRYWILCASTTDTVFAFGIVGDLLKDEANIRFQTNESFTDFFNQASNRWKSDELDWGPASGSTDTQSTHSPNLPKAHPAITAENMTENLGCRTVDNTEAGDIHSSHNEDITLPDLGGLDLWHDYSQYGGEDLNHWFPDSAQGHSNAVVNESSSNFAVSSDSMVLDPHHRFISELNHSPPPTFDSPRASSQASEPMDLETRPSSPIGQISCSLAPNALTDDPKVSFGECVAEQLHRSGMADDLHLSCDGTHENLNFVNVAVDGREGHASPRSDVSSLTDLDEDKEEGKCQLLTINRS